MNAISTKIKLRAIANDKFYTPLKLVNIHLDKFNIHNSIIYEPFKGNGSYYNLMKEKYTDCNVIYSEIDEGLDFFDYHDKVDYIISNPPYSIIDKVLEHSVSLKPKIISYLIGFGNLTTKRIEYMNKYGYYIIDFHLTKVWKWYGMSLIVSFSNEVDKNIISFDRIVHR
jgi:hypothetical protein